MFWTKRPPFCDLMLHTADAELGEYSILDATIVAPDDISAFRRYPTTSLLPLNGAHIGQGLRRCRFC